MVLDYFSNLSKVNTCKVCCCVREIAPGARGWWHAGSPSADVSAVSHMSERPQEARAHARGRAYRKALCCRSLPGKNYCLKYPALLFFFFLFYLKALFTPALSVISSSLLLYLPLLALCHPFVLQLLCFFR